MKAYLGLALLVFVIVAGWRIGNSLDSDALGMAIGMFFGILAGIPTAILMLLSSRRQERKQNQQSSHGQPMQNGQPMQHGQPMQNPTPYPQQPLIIVTGGQPSGQPNNVPPNSGFAHQQIDTEDSFSKQQQQERKFRVVGESEEWLDEW